LNYVSIPVQSLIESLTEEKKSNVEKNNCSRATLPAQSKDLYSISPLGKFTLASPLVLVPTLKLFLSSFSSEELEQIWHKEKKIILTTKIKNQLCDFTLCQQPSSPSSSYSTSSLHSSKEQNNSSSVNLSSCSSSNITHHQTSSNNENIPHRNCQSNTGNFTTTKEYSRLPRFVVDVEQNQVLDVWEKQGLKHDRISTYQRRGFSARFRRMSSVVKTRRRTSPQKIEEGLLGHQQISQENITKSKMESILDSIRERKAARLSQKKLTNTV